MFLPLFNMANIFINSKRVIQETAEATGDLISNELIIELQKSQKIDNKLIQKQLEMSRIKKYLKIYIYIYIYIYISRIKRE